jgi:DNA-binding response OmpR family regulator
MMTTVTELRVMVLGNPMTVKRIAECISEVGINPVPVSDVPEALTRLKLERFDVVVIDSLLTEAYSAVQNISESGRVPVALLTREHNTNWQNLRSWEVDGFLPEEAGNFELVARIKAISRRATLTSKAPDEDVNPG